MFFLWRKKQKKPHTNCISDKTTGFKFKCFYSMPLIICSRGSGGAEQTGIYTSALQLVSPVCLKSPLLLKRHTSMLLKGKVDLKKKAYTIDNNFSKGPDGLGVRQIKFPDDHVLISCVFQNVRPCLLRPLEVSARHDDACTYKVRSTEHKLVTNSIIKYSPSLQSISLGEHRDLKSPQVSLGKT